MDVASSPDDESGLSDVESVSFVSVLLNLASILVNLQSQFRDKLTI